MSLKKLAAAAVAAAALSSPAAAAAHERPSVASVKSHAAKAEAALDRVQALVAGNDDAAAAVAYAKSRVQSQAADGDARRLAALSGKGAAKRAAKANAVLANLHDDNVDAFAELVEHADANQVAFAKALAASAKGRDAALTALAGLADRLPAAAQAGIAQALAAINGDGEQEIEGIAGMTASATVPDEAKPWVTLALGYATQGMAHAIDHLNEVLGLVPEQARPHVEMALAQVTGALQRVSGILAGLLGGEGVAGALPIPQGLPIPQNLPIPGFAPIG